MRGTLGKHWKLSAETKKKISLSKMGNKNGFKQDEISWNKGLTKETDERIKRIGLLTSKRFKGKKQTKEHTNKVIKSREGIKYPKYIYPNFGMRNKKMSEEIKRKISNSKKGKKLSEETKRKIGLKSKGRKKTPEEIKKILHRREKSSLEIKFEDIINKIGLPYRFVGNGEVLVARKVPDFVHKDKKIAIEVYYRKHKEKFRGSLEVWKAERIKIFNKNGWQIIFFDETQVNEDNIKLILEKYQR